MQQRNRLVSTLKMSIQECVERQRAAKRIQETMMQDESGQDLLMALRTSLDATSIEMLEEIIVEARKFQVLKLPDFVQMVLDHAMGSMGSMGDSEKDPHQLLQDSLLDAVQEAVELGEDLFEMDELRTNVMDKVEAFKIVMQKASTSRIQDKLKSLEPRKEEESKEFLEAEPEDRESHQRELFPASEESETQGRAKEPGVPRVPVCAAEGLEEPRKASCEMLPAIANFDAVSSSRDVDAHLDPACSEGSFREPELLDGFEPEIQAASTSASETRSSQSSQPGIREVPSKVHSARLPLQHPDASYRGSPALAAPEVASQADAESELMDVCQKSGSKFRSTWHGKLIILGPSTSERLATRATTSGTGGDRFPVLPMYRNASKEAKRSDFRQKQKAITVPSTLDYDLPKLGQIQPTGSWRSKSKGSGRFGYTLPEAPRREGPHPLASPRRNPPSHPAPRQMAWTLLPGITD